MPADSVVVSPVRSRAVGRLEPCAGKLACTVLRGEPAGNGRFLPDEKAIAHPVDSCAAGYNLRWLLRAIARLGIGALFLRLLQAALLAPQTTAGSYGTHRRAWTDA